MYIPIYKNRMYEMNFLKGYGNFFEEELITPYIEIIDLKIGRTRCSEEELINFFHDNINTNFFVDFFAYSDEVYSQVKVQSVQDSLIFRNDNKNEYLQRLKKTNQSSRAIPIISVNNSRDNITSVDDIEYIITNLQAEKKAIGIRLKAEIFDNYYNCIKSLLRNDDYLFFDIGENNLDPFILEVMEFSQEEGFKKILVNSPRKRNLSNTSYLQSGYTDLIDNFARDVYKNEGFNGYSDYSGLKDDLPKSGGGSFGSALAMMFDSNVNKFYTIRNEDTRDGIRGYNFVIAEILDEKIMKILEAEDCLAYDYIFNMISDDKGRNGNYATWNYITLVRMLSEIKKSINNSYL